MLSSSKRDAGGDPITVLVVDDDAALRKSFCRLLNRAGIETIAVSSGRAATELLAQQTVDVVLSDVRMPDMDGIELLKRVREEDQNVAVVLISGAPDLETALEAVQHGATEYLTKPILSAPLVASLERAAGTTRNKRQQEADLQRLRTGQEQRNSVEPASGSWTGTILGGRYEIGEQLGSGGMGVVYEARRVDLADKVVAIKILHRHLRFHEEILGRFRREAEVVARLNHENIVQVLDYEAPEDGPALIVMERLRGHPLSNVLLGQGCLPVPRVAFIATQTLFALEAAHTAGVVHRDLKPENIFLTSMSGVPDIVRVLDFGIAKFIDQEENVRLTQTGAIMGTPLYLAPEQARGENVDARSDLYSLGSIMYEALSGRVVFSAKSYNELLECVQRIQPRPLTELRSDLDPRLAEVVEKSLAKDPDDRFQSAREMINALAPWLDSIEPGTDPPPGTSSRASGKYPVSDPYRTTRKVPHEDK